MKKSLWLFLITPLLLVSSAYLLQVKLLLSPDVGVLLDEAGRVLTGGRHVKDFFETNPPMAIYLYIPVCLFAKLTTLNIILALRLYVFFILFMAIGLSYFLLTKIINSKDSLMLYVMTFALLSICLFLPMHEFGQREHLFFLLTLPYLFAVVLAHEAKPVTGKLAALIGIMAACGFALKPYFLMLLLLLELSLVIKKRHWLGWLRIESLVIAASMIIYLASVFWFQPEYINVILPLVYHYYLGAQNFTWFEVMFSASTSIFWLSVASFVLFYSVDNYRRLNSIICLGMIGMYGAYTLPKLLSFYHIIPALSLALLLAASYLGQFGERYIKTKAREMLLAVLFIVTCFGGLLVETMVHEMAIANVLLHPAVNRELKTFINSQSGEHSLYCISTFGTMDCFPLAMLTQSRYAGRLPFVWWVSGIEKMQQRALPAEQLAKVNLDKKFLIDSIADDLNYYQPRWVLLKYVGMKDSLAENAKLRLAWGHYRYLMRVKSTWVYERKK